MSPERTWLDERRAQEQYRVLVRLKRDWALLADQLVWEESMDFLVDPIPEVP